MKRTIGAAGMVMLVLDACGAPVEPASPAGPEKPQVVAPPASAPDNDSRPASDLEPPFAEAELAALRGKLQGAWVIHSGQMGEKEAWSIEGDTVVISDGKEERRRGLQVVAPCNAGLVSEGEYGTVTNYFAFAFDGDQLYSGTAHAGVKRGNDIIACNLSGIYTHVEGRCFHWEQHILRAKEWKKTALTCSIREVDGRSEFVAEDPKFGTQTFRIEGNALVHPILDLDRSMARRYPDIAAARQALATN